LPPLQRHLLRAGPAGRAQSPCRVHRHSPCRLRRAKARSPEVFRLSGLRGEWRASFSGSSRRSPGDRPFADDGSIGSVHEARTEHAGAQGRLVEMDSGHLSGSRYGTAMGPMLPCSIRTVKRGMRLCDGFARSR
jgi:hypothetical protein